jgi:hypothetical protein
MMGWFSEFVLLVGFRHLLLVFFFLQRQTVW